MGNNSGSRGGNGGGGGNQNNNNRGTGQKKKCRNCGKEGYHKEDDCLELPMNKGKRKPGWKSVFVGMKNTHYNK